MPSRIQLRVVNKRNYKLACDINETMFFGTSFNCDYKVVVDAYKLNQYCAKYTSKVGQERTLANQGCSRFFFGGLNERTLRTSNVNFSFFVFLLIVQGCTDIQGVYAGV